MKKTILAGTALVAALAFLASGETGRLPDRWFYVSTRLADDGELHLVEQIVRTAADHGLNGMLLDGGFDALDLASAAELRRLAHLKQTCDGLKIEIIPLGFSAGYGDGVLQHDRNLAAGLPVHGALFVAGVGEARFQADSPGLRLVNGGFEERGEGGLPAGYTLLGGRAVLDTTVFHGGQASVRLEASARGGGEPRLEQILQVHPFRSYRLRCWVKTENAPPRASFHLWAIAPDGRDLAYMEPLLPSTSEWRELVWSFNSWYADRINFRVGISEATAGKVWVDDLDVEEVGLMNVVRRAGAPLTVRDEATATVYEEGRDFAAVSDPNLDFLWTHEMPSIRLLPASRIRNG